MLRRPSDLNGEGEAGRPGAADARSLYPPGGDARLLEETAGEWLGELENASCGRGPGSWRTYATSIDVVVAL